MRRSSSTPLLQPVVQSPRVPRCQVSGSFSHPRRERLIHLLDLEEDAREDLMLLSKAMVQHWTNQSPPLAVRGQRAIRGKRQRVQAHRMALGGPRVNCSRLGVEVRRRANTRKLLRDSRATGGYSRLSSPSGSSSHWGQVAVFAPGTLQVHHKEMDNVPAMNPPGTLQIHFEFPTQFTSDDPSWDMHSTLTVFQLM